MALATVDTELTDSDTLSFDAALNEVAGHLNAQHARLIDLTIAMLADESLWVGEGAHTPELFLAWRTGLAPQRARQIVAIARRATELPDSIDACRRGELAIDQLAAIANRAPWWSDHEVCEIAKQLTVSQLRRTLATYPFPDIAPPDNAGAAGVDAADHQTGDTADTSSDGTTPPEANQTAPSGSDDEDARAAATQGPGGVDGAAATGHLWWGVGDDGVFRLHLDCDQLAGMTIDAALREARDHLIRQGHEHVSDVDAFLEVCQRSLDGIDTPARRERFRTNVFIKADGTCCDDHGWNLPDAIRQYITCDGLMSPVFIDASIPISVGRSQRTIPLRTRRIVIQRDQGCRIPGCTVTHHIEVHHIIHWEDDGPTDTWNLIALCPRHHRMHHRGELGITGNADSPNGVTFTNRHGRVLATTGARPEPPGAPPTPPAGVYEHPLGERLDPHWLYFNPPAGHRATAWAHHPHNPLRAS
jgi:hypothetical protein